MTVVAPQSILFVTRKWAPAVGGMELYSHKLTESLQAITPLEILKLPGQDNGHPPHMRALWRFAFHAALKIVLRRKALDVIHLGDVVLWPLGLLGRLRSRRTRIVLSAHGTDVSYHRRGGFRGCVYGAYLRGGARVLRCSTMIANSEATRKIVRETGWSRVEVIPLATDVRGPEPTGEHGGSILFVGRLIERKGCGWFIRNVLTRMPDERLKVAGTCWDGEEVKALDCPQVEYLGILHGVDLINAYRQAKCVIVPNIEPASGEFEGFGLVATEAAAAGGVVIAARTGGLSEAIRDGITGFGVPPGEPLAWVAAISEISRWEIGDRKKYLRRSMRYCRDYYSWNRVASETFRTYGLPSKQ